MKRLHTKANGQTVTWYINVYSKATPRIVLFISWKYGQLLRENASVMLPNGTKGESDHPHLPECDLTQLFVHVHVLHWRPTQPRWKF